MKNSSHSGAFDGLRLAAAFLVLYGHCFELTGQSDKEPLFVLTHGGTGLGEVAVYIFFAISGYLVTQSWRRDPSLLRFLIKRVLRIVPALVFVVGTCVLVVGPLLTKGGLHAYFHSYETWSYFKKILIYPTQYGLPGVFAQNPYPNVVNGSLWSLRVEFSLYLIVAVLGVLGLLRLAPLSLVIAAASLIVDMLLLHTHTLQHFAFIYQMKVFFSNAVPFFIGAMLAETDLSAKPLWVFAFIAVAATVLSVGTSVFHSLLLITLPIITILIARYGRCDFSRFGDFSYGVYLWSFVVQQVILTYFAETTPFSLFISAAPIIVMIAIFSWHVIEKPSLTLKPHR